MPNITILPFAYETFYPVMMLLGKLDGTEVVRVLLGQLAWILILTGVVTFGWKRGLRRYSAFGG